MLIPYFFINGYGVIDAFYICSFKNGEALSKRGSNLIQKVLEKEEPVIEQSLLTGLIVGKWPFHLDKHKGQMEYLEREEKSAHRQPLQ